MATPTDVLNRARSQIGVCENPMGSNSGTPYHAWYGSYCQGWQWCAIFVSWVIWHVDQALFYGLMTAYSGDYRNVGRVHMREIDLSQIAPGDICIWDRPVGGITDHIGFVESVSVGNFTTIEGNSGDCVKRNTHDRVQTSSCRYYFVRPNYSSTPTPTKRIQPQEDDMEIVSMESPRRFPAYADGGLANCKLDITDESPDGRGAKIRLSYRGNNPGPNGEFGYGPPAFSTKWTRDITGETSLFFDFFKETGIKGYVSLKVEVLSGGPVGVIRRQDL